MQKWNSRINLVGNADPLVVIQTHFVDSLTCALSGAIHPHTRLLDIGTGAGFPSIPLKIYEPDLHVTAVDAVAKKIIFLRQLCRNLHLQHMNCMASRIEALKPCQPVDEQSPYCFDVIVSRAVGTLPHLIELAMPFLASGGCLLLQRGRRTPQELEEHAMLFKEKGLAVQKHQKFHMSWLEHPRHLVSLRRSSPLNS